MLAASDFAFSFFPYFVIYSSFWKDTICTVTSLIFCCIIKSWRTSQLSWECWHNFFLVRMHDQFTQVVSDCAQSDVTYSKNFEYLPNGTLNMQNIQMVTTLLALLASKEVWDLIMVLQLISMFKTLNKFKVLWLGSLWCW